VGAGLYTAARSRGGEESDRLQLSVCRKIGLWLGSVMVSDILNARIWRMDRAS
jgi:hypothetical protein